LARLLKLLGSSDYDLGRNGPFEFHPELWSFEDIAEEDGSTAIDSSDEEDHDPLNADWESVRQWYDGANYYPQLYDFIFLGSPLASG